ncbi:MAG: Gfo/Idh/MocA family oxidoreductase [Fibrobacteria bacterium]|nr:Gfo/Idh/MocA family oxidoreductase [Fibrobacteria bacterium]
MNKSKSLSIGIIGYANIAIRSIIPAIIKNENFNLFGIATKSKYSQAKHDFGDKVNIYNDYKDLLNDSAINCIYIALPVGSHEKWIKKALLKGKHIYTEKSFGFNYSSVLELIQIAKTKKLALIEGYMFQYHNQLTKIKELVNSGSIGELREIHSRFGFPPLDGKNFRYDPFLGGGALFDAAGYPIRLAGFLLGNEIEYKGSYNLFEDESPLMTTYGSLLLASKTCSATLSYGFDNYYQCNCNIWGSKGYMTIPKIFTPKENENVRIELVTKNDTEIINIEPDNHFKNILDVFASAIYDKNKRDILFQEILFQSKIQSKILMDML